MQQLQPGTLLQGGKYKIERVLGQGGFGITYLVRNEMLNGHMAVKEFFLQDENDRVENGTRVTVPHETKRGLFEEQRAKFKKEAQRMFGLRNEHIVQIHDLFEENDTVYYAMDYVEGESLKKRMARTGMLFSEQQAWEIVPQILDALDVMHQHQIYHLDLKPDNILLDRNDVVKVIDFGASKQFGTSAVLTSLTAFPYTPGYAPKEQKDQKADQVGPWTDFYALGATLYKILTGENPSNIDVVEYGEEAFHFGSGVSQKMQRLIVWLMQPQMRRRPQSVDEIRGYLHSESIEPRQGGIDTDNDATIVEPRVSSVGTTPITPVPQGPVVLMEEPYKPKTNWIVVALLICIFLAIAFGFVLLLGECQHDSKPVSTSDEKSVEQLDPVIQNLVDNMVHVEGGTFMMGATSEQIIADNDEYPIHQVTLSSYSLGRFEVTQEEWEAVMKSNPSSFVGPKQPVEFVCWNDCLEFIHRLNEITGLEFRMPTEAEWEFAARGGNKTQGYIYSGGNNLNSLAWYADNSGGTTNQVGLKVPNELGLYDMTGNLWEWCSDWYGPYREQQQQNPKGPQTGSSRVLRGGGWNGQGKNCRITNRDGRAPNYSSDRLGLRLAQ